MQCSFLLKFGYGFAEIAGALYNEGSIACFCPFTTGYYSARVLQDVCVERYIRYKLLVSCLLLLLKRWNESKSWVYSNKLSSFDDVIIINISYFTHCLFSSNAKARPSEKRVRCLTYVKVSLSSSNMCLSSDKSTQLACQLFGNYTAPLRRHSYNTTNGVCISTLIFHLRGNWIVRIWGIHWL